MRNSPPSFNKTASNFTSIHSNSLTKNNPINQGFNITNTQNNSITTPLSNQNANNISTLNNTFNSINHSLINGKISKDSILKSKDKQINNLNSLINKQYKPYNHKERKKYTEGFNNLNLGNVGTANQYINANNYQQNHTINIQSFMNQTSLTSFCSNNNNGNNNRFGTSKSPPKINNNNQQNVYSILQQQNQQDQVCAPKSLLQKLQKKIYLRYLVGSGPNNSQSKREQQWKHYMLKSQLLQQKQQKTKDFYEIQEYLIKWIYRLLEGRQKRIKQNKLSFTTNKKFEKIQDTDEVFQKSYLKDNQRESKSKDNKLTKQITFCDDQKSQKNLFSSLNNLVNKKNQQQDSQSIPKLLFDKSLLQKKIQIYEQKIRQLQFKLNYKQGRESQKWSSNNDQKYQSYVSGNIINKNNNNGQSNNGESFPNENNIRQSQNQSIKTPNPNTQPSSNPHTHKNIPTQPQRIPKSKQQFNVIMLDLTRYKRQLQLKKIQNQTFMQQIYFMKQCKQKLNFELEQAKQKCNQLVSLNQVYKQYIKYKQLWLMQNQQTISWRQMYYQKCTENTKSLNKIKILKQKNKQLLHSFNFSVVVNPDQQQDKLQLDHIMKNFQEWLKIMSVPRVNYNVSGFGVKEMMDNSNVNTTNQKQIKINRNSDKANTPFSLNTNSNTTEYLPDPQNINYKLLKPNFFIFFEAYQKTIIMQKNILNTRPLEQTFFVKIRAILDSMYNHFNIYSSSYKYWPNFPQFVMGFMQKYQISYSTHKLEIRKKPMPSQQKLTFLMNLFNKKMSNTWQCDMFRSFMLQEYTLDQIYFFLDCRNDINGGMILMHGFGKADPISYVKLSQALATIEKKLTPYQTQIIEKVKNIVINRKKQKGVQFFVDRYFVLKLLLEVYSLEKGKSLKIFQQSFNNGGKGKNMNGSSIKPQNITYLDFHNFMLKNFDFLTTIDICQLYRQAYSLSSGRISHKTIHYICTSKGLFIPLIWAKRLNMNILQKGLLSDMMLIDLQNNSRKINLHLQQFGVQTLGKIQNDMNYFIRQLDYYRNNRQFFYYKLNQQKMKIIQASSALSWINCTHRPNQILSSQQIRQSILQLHQLIHKNDMNLKKISTKREQRQSALKMITKNFKIRIQQSMSQFQKVDQQQIKKIKQHIQMDIKMKQFRAKASKANLNNSVGFRNEEEQKQNKSNKQYLMKKDKSNGGSKKNVSLNPNVQNLQNKKTSSIKLIQKQ